MRGKGTTVSDFFYKESKSKKKKILFFFVWGWRGMLELMIFFWGGTRINDFFTKDPNLISLFGVGGGRGE